MYSISADCEAFFSEKGHNNFFYPKENKKTILPKGTNIKIMPWISIRNLVPVRVEKKNVFDLLQTSIPGKFVILWVNKNLIKRDYEKYYNKSDS
tara:strand:- start:123 stop:404 length:282 start_codon:yes stop_codon:yes gene_type:complete